MSLRQKSLSLLLSLCACLISPQRSEAGLIPWVYDAIFGYGPAFGGGWGGGAGYGSPGFGCLGGGCLFGGCMRGGYPYPMAGYGYPSGGFYGGYAPAYGVSAPAYAASYANPCSSCGGTTNLNYAPAYGCGACGGVSTYGSGCSPCGTNTQYSPPADTGTGNPTPADKTPPADGFKGVEPKGNDGDVVPSGGDAGPWNTPIQPTNPLGDPPPNPNPNEFKLEKPVIPDDTRVEPTNIEPKVASSIEPVRRRTSFITSFSVPSVARVAVSPSSRSTMPTNVASK